MSFETHPVNLLHDAGAPEFVTVEAQRLLDLSIAHFEAETGRTLSPSQVEMYLLETIAYMLSIRGGEEQLAFENCFIAFARSDWLDKHGAGRNTPRLEALPALTSLEFSIPAILVAQIIIPAGTRVSDANGVATFLTLAAAVIPAGDLTVQVAAKATTSGISANGYAPGTITSLIDPIAGVTSVQNLTETSAGANRETDPRYRARLALAFERITRGGSLEAYRAITFTWNTRVLDVAVIRSQPGHIDVHPLMDTGVPTAGEITSLLAFLQDDKIPQGDYVSVLVPVAHDFTAELHLVVSDPAAVDVAVAAVHAVLDIWARELGGHIAPSELIAAAKGVAGVIDADILNLSLTSIAKNAWRNCTGLLVTDAVL